MSKLKQNWMPMFEDVVTDAWLDEVIQCGEWDPEHGSDVQRLVDDILDGQAAPCPPTCLGMDSIDALDQPEMKIAIRTFLKDRYENYIAPAFYNVRNDLTVKRMMYVDTDWTAQVNEGNATIGNYWGFPLDEDANYWMEKKNGQVLVLLTARLPVSSVDWIATFRQRMDYIFGDEENEIRTFPNSQVQLTTMQVDEQVVEFDNLSLSTGDFWPRVSKEAEPTGLSF